MQRITHLLLIAIVAVSTVTAQTPQKPTQQETDNQDIVRVTTSLIQTDVVVTDKNDQIIDDLKLSDFKLLENGKKQDLQFMEFVKGSTEPRSEGTIEIAGKPVEPEVARNLSVKDLRRVFAFVIDDLTIPFEDIYTVRKMLTDFVDNKMQQGDLVAIIRVVGGSGFLQQFTSDKAILRRAISQIAARTSVYNAFNNLQTPGQINTERANAIALEATGGTSFVPEQISAENGNLDASEDGSVKAQRALSTLVTAADVIDSMKLLPGRKNLIMLSGGLPIFESGQQQITIGGAQVTVEESRTYITNVSYLIRQLADRASRAGVVINTMDIRGLKAQRGVALFTDPGNEATSALFGGANGGGASFGRGVNPGVFNNSALDTMSGHQGLQMLSDITGGVSVVNSDNFSSGLDKIIGRNSYYLLAYRPSEPFDGKFHKIEIKVDRAGAKVYSRVGYYARADQPAKDLTKEQMIVRAARSPLARRDVNIAGNLQYRFGADNRADVDVNLAIDANNLDFKQDADGKYHATFDVVGFLIDGVGRQQDGFSQTVTSSFTAEEYKQALANGISFTGHATLGAGHYQLRAVVREEETGRMGTVSQYLEVPDLTKKRLAMSSLFLYAVDLSAGATAAPMPLNALRQIPRKFDIRYAAVIYNPRLDGGKPQLKWQLFVTQGTRLLFKSAEQPVRGSVQNGQMAQVGQISLAKAPAGRYILTLVITDPLADKKAQVIVRSIDVNLTN